MGGRLRPVVRRWGIYMDIPVPFTRYTIVLDLGWHKEPDEPAQPIWAVGYRRRIHTWRL